MRLRERERPMQSPPVDPNVADIAPTERALTPYDHEHAITVADAGCRKWLATRSQAATPSLSPFARNRSICKLTTVKARTPYQLRQARAYICAASSSVTNMVEPPQHPVLA